MKKSGAIICTDESYKKAVRLTFAKGASLKDPAGLLNASLALNGSSKSKRSKGARP